MPPNIRSVFLWAVRRQHRPLADRGQRGLRAARDPAVRGGHRYRRRFRRRACNSNEQGARRADRSVRPGTGLSQPLQQSRLPDKRRFPHVEERLWIWLHLAAPGEHERTVPVLAAPNGATFNTFGTNPPLFLGTARATSRAIRGLQTTNFSAFGDFWIQRSLDTASTHFDPRVSLVFHPDSDVIRLTGAARTASRINPC